MHLIVNCTFNSKQLSCYEIKYLNMNHARLPTFQLFKILLNFASLPSPVEEFSVSICSTPKFNSTSDDGVPKVINHRK